MQEIKLVIVYDHKAQIAHKVTAKTSAREISVHPALFAYAQVAQQGCPHSKMKLVRLLIQDQPTISTSEAVAIACGLMVDSQTRLISSDSAEDRYHVDVQYQSVDYTGLRHLNA